MSKAIQDRYEFVPEMQEHIKAKHISQEEVLALIRLYKKEKTEEKRDDLRSKVINTHTNLILHLAHKIAKMSRSSVSDLFQSGVIGLMIAVDKFDLKKKNQFHTFAFYEIRKQMQGESMNSMPIQVLPQLRTNCKRYLQIKEQDNQQSVVDRVKKRKLGSISSLETASKIFFDQRTFVSLQQPVGEDADAGSLENILIDKHSVNVEDAMVRRVLLDEVRTAVESLSEIERMVIKDKFLDSNGSKVTRRAIAKKTGMSNEGTRQIEIRAINNLRDILGGKL